jgi:uncharacterized protein (TIGR02996 family)
MIDSREAGFLRAIAEEGDDNTSRLVFADWLEEHDDSPRAEFIRVQCELGSPQLAENRRLELRVRERELLNGHRQQWCQAFELPIEDITFERGLITRMRLSRWDGGKLLDPTYALRFATLTELDLSGLQIGDDGLTAFAECTHFPALRKLILSDNGITDVGGDALAEATGLPDLDTIYLFQNSISGDTRSALEHTFHFTLRNLDLGGHEDGYCMSSGQAEMARRTYVREQLLPLVARYFTTYERLQSAMLCVAQYWADEADDAVHDTMIVSELFEPTLEGVEWDDESGVDPNLPNTRINSKYGSGSAVSLYEADVNWQDNSGAIPLWAAFAPEGGSQDFGIEENYAPAVMFYRHGGYYFFPMKRPHLDGIRPEWGWEDE